MPTQNVNLTPELDQFVKDEVASGHFNNASEVHRAALAEMARGKEERELRLARLRGEIQRGLEDVEAGRVRQVEGRDGIGAMMDACLERALERLETVNAELP